MSTRSRAKKAKGSNGEAVAALTRVIDETLDNVKCPITTALPVCPVIAEDGRTYEKRAIERWFQNKAISPLTRAPIGTRLVDVPQTRSIIRMAIDAGTVGDSAAAEWHLGTAKAIATGDLTCALSEMKDHLDRADALSSSPEIKRLLRAVELKLQVDALAKDGADAGCDVVALILGVPAPEPRAQIEDSASASDSEDNWRPVGRRDEARPRRVVNYPTEYLRLGSLGLSQISQQDIIHSEGPDDLSGLPLVPRRAPP